MVCLGNICRSPLAEGILKHKIKQQNQRTEIKKTTQTHVRSNVHVAKQETNVITYTSTKIPLSND